LTKKGTLSSAGFVQRIN